MPAMPGYGCGKEGEGGMTKTTKRKRKAELTRLTLRIKDGSVVNVDATVVGDLALHRAVLDDRKYSVTHVPTGLVINAAVPEKIRDDVPRLLKWMRLVQDGVKKDWTLMRKISHENAVENPDVTRVIRDRIKTHCLSIGEDQL